MNNITWLQLMGQLRCSFGWSVVWFCFCKWSHLNCIDGMLEVVKKGGGSPVLSLRWYELQQRCWNWYREAGGWSVPGQLVCDSVRCARDIAGWCNGGCGKDQSSCSSFWCYVFLWSSNHFLKEMQKGISLFYSWWCGNLLPPKNHDWNGKCYIYIHSY